MVIREIKKCRWEHIYRQIATCGRAAPLSLQFDIDISLNGVDYILKVQPVMTEKTRKIIALQALGVYPDGGGIGGKDFHLIEEYNVIAALLDMVIYQGAAKRNR